MKKSKKYFSIAILNIIFAAFFISGCAKQGEGRKQDAENLQSSPHAFLLGSETFYYIDLPADWVADLSDVRHLGLYWPDQQEGDVCGVSVSRAEHDLGRKAKVLYEYDTAFDFVNGMTGLRQFYEQEGGVSAYGEDERQYQIEKIFSDDMNECIGVRMVKEKYERNRDTIEQVLHASYFQTNTVGMSCDIPLEERELVCVHTNNGAFALQIMVPEGVSFYEGAYDWFGDDMAGEDTQLVFYLDDTKEQYVQIFSDCQGYLCEDERLVWQQVQYDTMQITDAGQVVRSFQFEEGGEQYDWFSVEGFAVCVNAKDETIKKIAERMVESIRAE